MHGCMYLYMYLHACVHVDLWMYLYVDVYMLGKKSFIYFLKIQIDYLDYYTITFVNILHVEGFQQKIKNIF